MTLSNRLEKGCDVMCRSFGSHKNTTNLFLLFCLVLLSAVNVCPSYAAMTGCWTFDDTLDDSVGSVDGSFSDGTPIYIAGKVGNAVSLDGVNDYIVLGDSGDLNFASDTDFSIAIWVKTAGWSGDPSIISNKDWNSGAYTGYVVACGSSTWQWNYCGATGTRADYDPSSPTLNDGQWHHLCVTHDRNGYAKFYFDGVFQNQVSLAASTGTIDAGLPTVVGNDGTGTYQYYFNGAVDDLRIYNHLLSQSEIDQLQGPEGIDIQTGPYAQMTSPYSAVVYWDTDQVCNSIVEYGTTESLGLRTEDATSADSHEVALDELDYRTKYYYRVGYNDGENEIFSDVYSFDGAINYTRMDCSAVDSPYTADELTGLYEQAAQTIIDQSGISAGYCLVYGADNGRLAFELAKRSNLTIFGVDTDSAKVTTAINNMMQAGVYGARIKMRHVASLDSLPFTRNFFNLIVSDTMISQGSCPGGADEMFRVLRPSGGVAYLGQPAGCPSELTQAELENWLDDASLTYTTSNDTSGLWSMVVRDSLPGAGNWPRQYGGPDNAACTKDDLEGATQTSHLTIQWLGSPGADFGADRNPRMPTPVMAEGILYHMGLDRLVAIDSYNGFIYWSLEIPGSMRVNTPRDSGYYSADETGIFIAVDDDCLRLDGVTGQRTQTYTLDEDGFEWGYVAVLDDKLYGSAQYDGAHYTSFWGAESWYDATSGASTYKVCSRYIFANDKDTGTRIWTDDRPERGVAINSTITIGGGRIYFVESRNTAVTNYASGRIGLSELWSDQYIVALDQDTGAILWDEPINTEDGIVVFYMQYAEDKLFVSSSRTSYNIYGYSAVNGASLWSQNHNWTNNNHGGHMQHPVIVGSNIYLEPNGYDINTGSRVTTKVGLHEGCATYAGTEGALIYRGSGRRIAMWDIDSGAITVWDGIRPSCWLSTIPGGGMVLSPEGGGGCSCNGWLNTSVGFIKEQ